MQGNRRTLDQQNIIMLQLQKEVGEKHVRLDNEQLPLSFRLPPSSHCLIYSETKSKHYKLQQYNSHSHNRWTDALSNTPYKTLSTKLSFTFPISVIIITIAYIISIIIIPIPSAKQKKQNQFPLLSAFMQQQQSTTTTGQQQLTTYSYLYLHYTLPQPQASNSSTIPLLPEDCPRTSVRCGCTDTDTDTDT